MGLVVKPWHLTNIIKPTMLDGFKAQEAERLEKERIKKLEHEAIVERYRNDQQRQLKNLRYIAEAVKRNIRARKSEMQEKHLWFAAVVLADSFGDMKHPYLDYNKLGLGYYFDDSDIDIGKQDLAILNLAMNLKIPYFDKRSVESEGYPLELLKFLNILWVWYKKGDVLMAKLTI